MKQKKILQSTSFDGERQVYQSKYCSDGTRAWNNVHIYSGHNDRSLLILLGHCVTVTGHNFFLFSTEFQIIKNSLRLSTQRFFVQ